MKRKCLLSALTAVFIIFAVGMASALTTEEALKQNFPQIKAEKISPTPIKGIYEIITSGGILYFAPDTLNIIAGEIYAKDGRSLTHERRMEILKDKQKDIPLEKAFKMGSGTHKVIEFSNPDCGYCRKASQFLAGRKDITRYVFFLPFSPKTDPKVKYILCAKDKEKAYEEAMTGKLDDPAALKACDDKDVEALLNTHKELAHKLGINATPLFFIDGQVVQGADIPAMEKLLGKK
ncbi:MAG: Thiol:disulfide interchange protein DsbC [Syntrophus sp. SKADARSKE-3]|nr:Thiol:disulfide interchange protein DsbC [Syntrophus sp. SKADARSKE-3]